MVQSWDGAGRSAPGVASMAPGHPGWCNSRWGGPGEDQMVQSWDGAGRSAPGVASMAPGHSGRGNSRWGGPGEDQMDRSRYDLGRNGPRVEQTTRGHQGWHGSGRGDTGGSLACYGAKPTYSVAQVRQGRALLKCLGMSPFALALTIERQALKGVPSWLTPALLRAIGHAKGNIPGLMATARKKPCGGTGIPSTHPGEAFSMDIYGKYPKSTWNCCYSTGFQDEACTFADGFALEFKSDLDAAVVHWCQFVESCGKGPVRFCRFDAGSEVSRNGELVAEFKIVCAKYNILLIPSAPENQKTNPVERGYQTLSHRMAGMFLQQNNLTKDQWLMVWFAALVLSRLVCSGERTQTPCEEMCGFVPDLTHATSFYCGQTVMVPRPQKKKGLMVTGFQPAVYILPILANKAHLVLLEGQEDPQVRSDVQAVGLQLPELPEAELDKLKPTFDEKTGEMTDFHSRAIKRFSLQKVMEEYDKGVDLDREEKKEEEQQGVESIMDKAARLQSLPYQGPVITRAKASKRGETLRLTRLAAKNQQPVVEEAVTEEQPEEVMGPAQSENEALEEVWGADHAILLSACHAAVVQMFELNLTDDGSDEGGEPTAGGESGMSSTALGGSGMNSTAVGAAVAVGGSGMGSTAVGGSGMGSTAVGGSGG